MRQGFHDVLAESSLQNLTAEDLRLILCGCPQIDVDVLKKITLFNDESSECCMQSYIVINKNVAFLIVCIIRKRLRCLAAV